IGSIHVVGEGQGKVKRVGLYRRAAKAGVAQHDQLAPALWRNGIDGSRREAPCTTLLDRLNQPLLLQAVQGGVERADLYIAPELGSLELSLSADLVPMHGPVTGKHPEYKELRCVHRLLHSRVLHLLLLSSEYIMRCHAV